MIEKKDELVCTNMKKKLVLSEERKMKTLTGANMKNILMLSVEGRSRRNCLNWCDLVSVIDWCKLVLVHLILVLKIFSMILILPEQG